MSGIVRIACLAAGTSSRMGADHKLLRILSGKPVIHWVAEALRDFPEQKPFFVLGQRADSLENLIDGMTAIRNENFAKGMHSSLRTAVLHARSEDADALVITLADQPYFLRQRLRHLLSKDFSKLSLLRSLVGQHPGHPVLVGAGYFEEILDHEDGDFGCAYLFKKYAQRCEWVLQHESAIWDLDTEDDFARLALTSSDDSLRQ